MAKRIPKQGQYYGLQAISEKTGWSSFVIRKNILKYRFPACRMPKADGKGWCWFTSDDLINRWYQLMCEDSWLYLAGTKTAINLLPTRDPRRKPAGSPATTDNEVNP